MTILEKIFIVALGISIALNVGQKIDLIFTKDDLKASEKQVEILTSSIEQQNDAIKEMKEESDKQVSKLMLAEIEAKKERDSYTKKIKQLLKQKVPSDCNDAMMWGAEKGVQIYQVWISELN